MLSRIFGNKGDYRVGPPLETLYSKLNDQQKGDFRKQISRVPSGCEMVINLDNLTSEMVAKGIKEMTQRCNQTNLNYNINHPV